MCVGGNLLKIFFIKEKELMTPSLWVSVPEARVASTQNYNPEVPQPGQPQGLR